MMKKKDLIKASLLVALVSYILLETQNLIEQKQYHITELLTQNTLYLSNNLVSFGTSGASTASEYTGTLVKVS